MTSDNALPVTVVISRTPIPGHEEDLDQWAHGVTDAASAFEGHLGAQIFAPGQTDTGDLVLAFSFSSAEALSTWEHSDERASWLAKLDGMVVGETKSVSVSGFEGIFSHAPGAPVIPPPRWKTAAIIAIALYPMSLVLNWLVAPHIGGWNIFLRVLLTTAIIVPYMAWIGVPYLTRWLKGWLRR